MSDSLTALLADYFKARPGIWIDGRVLATFAGSYGWRSRISECRTDLGMDIINRQRKVGTVGRKRTISEYLFVPASAPQHETPHDLNVPWGLR